MLKGNREIFIKEIEVAGLVCEVFNFDLLNLL